MPNLDCSSSIALLLALYDPTADPNFINPLYDPTRYNSWDRGPYTLNFFYQGNPYDFSQWYKSGTMYIEKIKGFEPGQCRFDYWDADTSFFNLPFEPIGNMMFDVWNHNETEHYGRFLVQDLKQRHINRRPDGTETKCITLTGIDLKGDFKRWQFSEVYPPNTTTYAVMKDAITRHTPFDASNIDETKGYKLPGYKVDRRFVADVMQELLDLEITTTFKLNDLTGEVFLGDVNDPTFNFLEINEENVYDYFRIGDFFVNQQTQILRNRVHFWFNGLYSVGTVNVTQGNTTIIGIGTKFKSKTRKGGNFTIEGDTTLYQVVDILNETDVVVSPPVVRTTASGLTYTSSGYRDYIVVDSADNIATIAAIRGETGTRAGVYEVNMPESPNPMTREQARAKAQAYVNRMTSNAILRGQAKTNNWKLGTANLSDGDTFLINLPRSRKIRATVAIQRLILEDKKGIIDRVNYPDKPYYDGVRIDPNHDITFDLTDRRLLTDTTIERILQDQRDVKITDDETVEALIQLSERILIGDCAGWVYGYGPNGNPGQPDPERLTLSDGASAQSITPGGSYYTAPVSMGQNEAYTLSMSTFAFTS